MGSRRAKKKDCRHFKVKFFDGTTNCFICDNHVEGRSFAVQYHGGGQMNNREAFREYTLAQAIRDQHEGARELGKEIESTTRWV